MKKNFYLILISISIAITVMLCLVGCKSEVELKTKEINGLTLSVPSDYDDFVEKEGFMVASGPNASITLSPASSSEGLTASWWTANNLKDMYNTTYTNIKIKSIENEGKLDDKPVVYAEFSATDKKGIDFEVYLIVLYRDETLLHINYILYKQGVESSTAQYINEIVKSIRIVK